MRNSIAAPLNDKFASDGEYDARFIDGRNASASAGELKTALAAHRPVFVATTSHGMTGPLNDVPRMQADLGLLVDAGFKMVRPQDLLGGGSPASRSGTRTPVARPTASRRRHSIVWCRRARMSIGSCRASLLAAT